MYFSSLKCAPVREVLTLLLSTLWMVKPTVCALPLALECSTVVEIVLVV